MLNHLLLAAAIAMIASLNARATTLILQPGAADGKDVCLYKRTDVPLSSSPSLYAINTGPPGPGFDDFKSLIEFDLSEVTAPIASARLWLYENNFPTFSFQHVSAEFTNTIEVRPAATPWTVDTVRYSTLPESVAGYSSTRVVDGVEEWFSWEVTDVLHDWLNETLPNYGFLVTSQIEVRDGLEVVGTSFASSEQPHSPYLEIELMDLLAGDYDRSGVVDGADFLLWQRQLGTPATPGAGADGTGDGVVDAVDLGVWRQNFGDGGLPAANVVAEPAATTLVLFGVVAAAIATGWRRATRLAAIVAALVALSLAPKHAFALIVPFTEDFAADLANWKNAANGELIYVPVGGVGGVGDGYVSTARTFTANPDFAQTIFRGQDGFNASGDAFVGDWLAGGVSQFSFWIRHNAPSDLTFSTRFATSANSPGANAVASPALAAPPNAWTRLTVPATTAAIAPEGPPSAFNAVFSNLGNLQISVRPGNNLNASLTFDLDRVSIVPEPTGVALAILGAPALVAVGRRRRWPGPAAALAALVLSTPLASADEVQQNVSQLTPLPEPLASFGAATLDGWLYVYGGHVGEKHDHSREHVRGTFRRQSLEGGTWEELPSGPPLQSPALVACESKLYRIGGLAARNSSSEPSDLHSTASVDCYDPQAQTWTAVGDLPEPRSSHDAAVLKNRIYVVGGWNHHGAEGEGEWLNSAAVLDPQKQGWRRIAKAPFKRRALALAAHDGRIFCIGGLTPTTGFSRRVDVYDPANGSWARGPRLPESEMNGFAASAFDVNGRLYASSLSDELLALSADGRNWKKAASLATPRFFHRLIPGPNGTVLLIGGANEDEGHLASIACVAPSMP